MDMKPLEEELMKVVLMRPALMKLAEEEEEKAVLKEYEVLMEP